MGLQPSICQRCGAAFACGRDDADGCWCARLPPLDASQIDPSRGCLCERCLAAELAAARPHSSQQS